MGLIYKSSLLKVLSIVLCITVGSLHINRSHADSKKTAITVALGIIALIIVGNILGAKQAAKQAQKNGEISPEALKKLDKTMMSQAAREASQDVQPSNGAIQCVPNAGSSSRSNTSQLQINNQSSSQGSGCQLLAGNDAQLCEQGLKKPSQWEQKLNHAQDSATEQVGTVGEMAITVAVQAGGQEVPSLGETAVGVQGAQSASNVSLVQEEIQAELEQLLSELEASCRAHLNEYNQIQPQHLQGNPAVGKINNVNGGQKAPELFEKYQLAQSAMIKPSVPQEQRAAVFQSQLQPYVLGELKKKWQKALSEMQRAINSVNAARNTLQFKKESTQLVSEKSVEAAVDGVVRSGELEDTTRVNSVISEAPVRSQNQLPTNDIYRNPAQIIEDPLVAPACED